MTRLLAAALAAAFPVACSGGTSGPAPGDIPLEAILYGGKGTCKRSNECASGVCSFGTCAGLLAADRPWMIEEISSHLAAATDGKPERDAAVRLLAALVADGKPDLDQRARAAYALGFLPGPASEEALEEALSAAEPGLRHRALLSLTRLGKRTDPRDLLPLLSSPDTFVRLDGLRALAGIGAAGPRVRALLGDASPVVVLWALRALAASADPDDRAVLEAFAKDGAPALRCVARAPLGPRS